MKIIMLIAAAAALASSAAHLGSDHADEAALNDVEMAHVAVTASNIDIAYAHLALAFSESPDIRQFAKTMIRDHSAVNGQVFALAQKLGVTAQDNDVSRQLLAQAQDIKDELSRLRGSDFDRRYAENEAAYHQMVNGVVKNDFIPNVQNDEVRAAFRGALEIFLVHQKHAEELAHQFGGM